jgi:carbon monoxide dehydrogenase subunit G
MRVEGTRTFSAPRATVWQVLNDPSRLAKTMPGVESFAKLAAKGNGVGAIMNMETAFHLSENAGGGTDMKWEADVKIAGPVGSMGQRVLQPIVNQQVGQVLTALDAQVQEASAQP